jgi:hypothetical protein
MWFNLLIHPYSVCVMTGYRLDSAPGHDANLRLVSLEPVWPEGVQSEKNFPEKWPVVELQKKKVTPLMLFNGKIPLYIFAVH